MNIIKNNFFSYFAIFFVMSNISMGLASRPLSNDCALVTSNKKEQTSDTFFLNAQEIASMQAYHSSLSHPYTQDLQQGTELICDQMQILNSLYAKKRTVQTKQEINKYVSALQYNFHHFVYNKVRTYRDFDYNDHPKFSQSIEENGYGLLLGDLLDITPQVNSILKKICNEAGKHFLINKCINADQESGLIHIPPTSEKSSSSDFTKDNPIYFMRHQENFKFTIISSNHDPASLPSFYLIPELDSTYSRACVLSKDESIQEFSSINLINYNLLFNSDLTQINRYISFSVYDGKNKIISNKMLILDIDKIYFLRDFITYFIGNNFLEKTCCVQFPFPITTQEKNIVKLLQLESLVKEKNNASDALKEHLQSHIQYIEEAENKPIEEIISTLETEIVLTYKNDEKIRFEQEARSKDVAKGETPGIKKSKKKQSKGKNKKGLKHRKTAVATEVEKEVESLIKKDFDIVKDLKAKAFITYEEFLKALNNVRKKLTIDQLAQIKMTWRGDHLNAHVEGGAGSTLVVNSNKPIRGDHASSFLQIILEGIF